ncbi:MFS transporter [Bacillus sp. FJAT-45350]|uniref:MFS transporter n=1 Tax=Bacillus sp. FJAT-45350 TaxID=2011014 RepID=UPI00211BF27B|nr:MFS transporter [Bacillus sp. FJAT-45350]
MIQNKSVFRLMAYLFFAYSTMTIIISYMPVYFQYQGLTGTEVGMLLAIGPFASIFSQPFWGFMSDKWKSIKRVLVITLIGVIISSFIFFQMSNFIGLMVMMFVLFLFMAPVTALGDSLSQKTAIEHKVNFGRIRMWGSLGFAITSLLTGYVLAVIGIGNLVFPFLFMAIISLVIALQLHDVNKTNKPVTLLNAVKIGLNPRLFIFLGIIILVSITHRANDSYLGIYVTELGGKESLIGWAWFIGVTSEALIFATTALWFRRFHPLTFIIIAGLLYSLRWFLMGMAVGPASIIFFQLLHGVTFGVFYVGAFQVVTKLVPEELQATGHVLFITTFFGISGIIGSLFGGYMIETVSTAALYHSLGYFALAGSIGLIIYKYVIEVKLKPEMRYSK